MVLDKQMEAKRTVLGQDRSCLGFTTYKFMGERKPLTIVFCKQEQNRKLLSKITEITKKEGLNQKVRSNARNDDSRTSLNLLRKEF